MSLIFITHVTTIIVPITDPGRGNAPAIIAAKLVCVAGSDQCGTGEGFIRAVTAVSPSITVPVGGDAAATRATELALGTCGLSTVCRTLITHIPTVVVSITQIRAWDANVGRLTFCLLWLAGSLRAVSFIRGAIVVAVVDTIANIVLCNTASVVTSKLCVWVTRSEQTAHFIAIVPAVIIMVAAVVVGHASPIATSKDGRLTSVEG